LFTWLKAKDDDSFYQGVEQTTQEDTLGKKKRETHKRN
jgi:hypothetical protein